MCGLWVTKRQKLVPTFYTTRKIIYPSFLRGRMVGGGWPLLPEILGQTDPVGEKTPIVNRYLLVAPRPSSLGLHQTSCPMCWQMTTHKQEAITRLLCILLIINVADTLHQQAHDYGVFWVFIKVPSAELEVNRIYSYCWDKMATQRCTIRIFTDMQVRVCVPLFNSLFLSNLWECRRKSCIAKN